MIHFIYVLERHDIEVESFYLGVNVTKEEAISRFFKIFGWFPQKFLDDKIKSYSLEQIFAKNYDDILYVDFYGVIPSYVLTLLLNLSIEELKSLKNFEYFSSYTLPEKFGNGND